MTTSRVKSLIRRALLAVIELRSAEGLSPYAYRSIIELLGLYEDDKLTRALLVATELRGAGGLTLEAYKNILSLLGLGEEGFPLTNGATAKPMDHQACLTNGLVDAKRETTAEGDSGVEGYEPVKTTSTSTDPGAGTADGTAATNFIGTATDTTAGTTASTSTGTAADTTACTAASAAGAKPTGTSDSTGATVTGIEPAPCAPVAVVCEQTGSPTTEPATSLDGAKKLRAVARQSRREESARNLEIRKAMANDSMPKREPADSVFVDEEADKIRKSEDLESCKSFSPSDRHHLAKPGELVLVASGLHDILVQTPDGDIVWRQSTELFRRAESMPHERARPSFDEHFTKCDEEGNLIVDDHRNPVVIQETMLKNTELSNRDGAETVVAPKETRQDHRLKKDGEVIIRWTENEIAVLKLNGDRVIRRAPEQFVRSYNLVNPTVPEEANDLEYHTCDAEGYQLKDAYGREAVLAETLRMRPEKG
ncbi:hypothetical protein DL766_001427 [Monosporascus sp. MC13-8B]|uniref:Centromere protein J C-terminal domain-containing protein n=1 Tax=Monosporascus cannonballus TaxID=155416 RepID=A0ABY0GWB7_9PEZI|nr:hypothetical protein DL762_008701 [Monosporascus cannonballus]RYP00428.1 hypothetical protein DL763_000780 [Monosporascus cannonballus]RYP37611.1 hypothetical protein DL766_001427 [Monosporascus sp. MC13-8B]